MTDQFIVPLKRGNARGGKGLAGARWTGRDTSTAQRGGLRMATKRDS
ncbi:MAG: hypothetical protein WAV32_02475 [Halobacteriota archaeon]